MIKEIKYFIQMFCVFLYYECIIKVKEDILKLVSEETAFNLKIFFIKSFPPYVFIQISIILTVLILIKGVNNLFTKVAVFGMLFVIFHFYKRFKSGEYKGWYRKKKGY